jgi:hypothetical protein
LFLPSRMMALLCGCARDEADLNSRYVGISTRLTFLWRVKREITSHLTNLERISANHTPQKVSWKLHKSDT